jgi:hypothetical protein
MRRRLGGLPIWLVALVMAAAAQITAQQRPESVATPDTSAISGVVIDGTTKQPIGDAIVVLSSESRNGGSTRRQQFTDAKGRYVFVNLPAGDRYGVTTSAIGYLEGVYAIDPEAPSDTSSTITLAADQWQQNIDVTMWRPSTIAGRVVDEQGDGIGGAFVRAVKRTRIGGTDVLAASRLTSTDDVGHYRLTDLTPGVYLVMVPSVQGAFVGARSTGQFPWAPPSGSNDRPRGYPPTFYPAVPSIGAATALAIGRAETRESIDVTLRPVPLYRVSGRLTAVLPRTGLRLIPAGMEALGNGGEAALAQTEADGTFEFAGVPSGTYTVDTTRSVTTVSAAGFRPNVFGGVAVPGPPPGGGSSGYSYPAGAAPGLNWGVTRYGRNDEVTAFPARQTISVGADDITELSVAIVGGATITGRIQLATGGNQPDAKLSASESALFLEPVNVTDGVPYPISLKDNEFVIPDVRPGRYFLRKRTSTKWIVQSVLASGVEHLTTAFDVGAAPVTLQVTLTNRVCAISGTTSAPGATVIVFPQLPSGWTEFGINPPAIRVVDATANGAFDIDLLPAGDYLIAAVSPSHRADGYSREFLALLATRATRVSLAWGDRHTANLTIVSVGR